MQQFGACGDGVAGGRALLGREPRDGLIVPRAARVNGAGEIGHKEQVEMGQVIGKVFDRMQDRRDQHSLIWHLRIRSVRQSKCRSRRLADRTDPANAGRDGQRVAWVFAQHHHFKPAEQRRIGVGRRDRAIADVQTDL